MDQSGEESSSSMASNGVSPCEISTGNPAPTLMSKLPSTPSIRHFFWEKQPVMQFDDIETDEQGPIMAPIPSSEVQQVPYNLPAIFEWATIDIEEDVSFSGLHRFLDENYQEASSFIYTYSKDFLRWVLGTPGNTKSLHVGVSTKKAKKLVCFISGVPAFVRIQEELLRVSIVNILCVHKKLRSKRFVPVLVKELARRAQLEGIWQGIYATTHFCPTPFCISKWSDRALNPVKLFNLGLLYVRQTITLDQVESLCKVPTETTIRGLRKMESHDVDKVTLLLQAHLKRFLFAPEVDRHFVEHFVAPKEGLVQTYVVENPETKAITDFCSFFVQKKTLENNHQYSELKYAVLFYYAASITPLEKLVGDLLIVASREGFDAVRTHRIAEYSGFLDRLLFSTPPNASSVNYYIYNYRLQVAFDPINMGLFIL
ncbi:hypothetical protein HPP92_008586 [Vanilla planifolia]|uniref:Glycylpeptide N-tetradecanoyltransferase n=1 Tax=Vanilla planifolia TaxID=51239 RepID=A0A835V812_VANPL|nr:hypothetical protein HPP92_008773 [Vanilla planifolia]KAG0486491.1 hypothetical protein HPP92_008586 [Vanilla planifolia]